VIQAEEFQLVDSQGTIRARLGCDKDGAVALSILDDGVPPAEVFSARLSSQAGSTIALTDQRRRRMLALTTDPGQASLTLSEGNVPRLRLALDLGSGPSISLLRKDMSVAFSISIQPNGDAIISGVKAKQED
jgi:hypothetical protein